jgi:hypothetical protein
MSGEKFALKLNNRIRAQRTTKAIHGIPETNRNVHGWTRSQYVDGASLACLTNSQRTRA